jgi:plasmid stabilization system protein ParE
MHIRWTQKALINLEDAVGYIAADNADAAHRVAQQIWDNSQRLMLQPALGHLGRVSGTREFIVAGLPYILPYTQNGDTIYILRVIHMAIAWPDRF